ncbi:MULTISPECIES: glycosyl hydrolase family 28 protein [Glycomyces]|uniref:Glycosyl hydrolase family 28 protein n=2 Tax=Glycomyces TaxID=58113 RepID=A0A9X3SVH2_9ACTN|nr:glycosyl hydrolase family 28 protein [Glycomyces lechevalierae]MDA1385964.1 glycosyl hydrolase family 28 protein [Glycomyces lechevalierae]MDR7340879.1 hypothetical protein [Glycomyces lechevalierae]
MTENPSRTSLSRRAVLQAGGAVAVAGYLATAANPASAQEPSAEDRLVTYPIPEGVARNSTFTVAVKNPGGQWTPVEAYNVRLKEIKLTGGDQFYQSSVASFDFSGTVEVKVTFTKAEVEQARVRPLSYGIESEVEDRSIHFTLTEPRKVVVEVNGLLYDCLHLLANAIDDDAPDPEDPGVVYFGPGVHTGGELAVQSGQTVYLAGGAVVKRKIAFNGVENASLRGRGVITGVDWGAAPVRSSKNILIEGVTVMNNPTGNLCDIGESEQVTVRDVSYFSSAKWGDGIDVFCSSEVLIEGMFMRSSDDCIALYAHRNDYYGDVRNITIRGSALWADLAHPINIGTHGNTEEPEVLENIVISDLDILDHREPQQNYQGCIAINPGDSNLVRNVRIQDVRVEDFRIGQIIHMRVAYNKSYNTSAGRGIESVFVRDMSYEGTHADTALLLGYDADHGIKDVVFQNFKVNGKVIADNMAKPGWYKASDMVPMHVNEHVTGVRFLKPETAPSTTPPAIIAAGEARTKTGANTVYTVSATGFPEAFEAEGLPEGLVFDTAAGVVSGAAVETGSYDVTFSAANGAGTVEHTTTFTVA